MHNVPGAWEAKTAGDFRDHHWDCGMWFSADGSTYLLLYDGMWKQGYGDQEAQNIAAAEIAGIEDMQMLLDVEDRPFRAQKEG